MWGRTCIPTKGYRVLYPYKKHFRCAQAQHFLVFCWLVSSAKTLMSHRRVIRSSRLPF
jgi:hypothetical protein